MSQGNIRNGRPKTRSFTKFLSQISTPHQNNAYSTLPTKLKLPSLIPTEINNRNSLIDPAILIPEAS